MLVKLISPLETKEQLIRFRVYGKITTSAQTDGWITTDGPLYTGGYHHNGFVATHALGHIMYGYTLLVPMNQRVLNKLSKERNISGHK